MLIAKHLLTATLILMAADQLFALPTRELPKDANEFIKDRCSTSDKDVEYLTDNKQKEVRTSPELQGVIEKDQARFTSSNHAKVLEKLNAPGKALTIPEKIAVCRLKEEMIDRQKLDIDFKSEPLTAQEKNAILEADETELNLLLLHSFEIAYVHRADRDAARILGLIKLINPNMALDLRELVSSTKNVCLLKKHPEFSKPSEADYTGLGRKATDASKPTRKSLIDWQQDPVIQSEMYGDCEVEGVRPGLFGFAVPKNYKDADKVLFPETPVFCRDDSGMISDGATPPPLRSDEQRQNPAAYKSCTTLGGGCHGWSAEAQWKGRHSIVNNSSASFLSSDIGKLSSLAAETLRTVFGGKTAGDSAAYRGNIRPDTLNTPDPSAVHPRPDENKQPEHNTPSTPKPDSSKPIDTTPDNNRPDDKYYNPIIRFAEECTITSKDRQNMIREFSKSYDPKVSDEKPDLMTPDPLHPEWDNRPDLAPVDVPVVNGKTPEATPNVKPRQPQLPDLSPGKITLPESKKGRDSIDRNQACKRLPELCN